MIWGGARAVLVLRDSLKVEEKRLKFKSLAAIV